MARKNALDLDQHLYNDGMKEMTQDSTAKDISFENLGMLLFMTQKAISDLKQLRSIFYHRKFTGGINMPQGNPVKY